MTKDKFKCTKCCDEGWIRREVADGNPYSYNYELKQDTITVIKACDWCNKDEKKPRPRGWSL